MPIAVIAAVVAAAGGVAWWGASRLAAIEDQAAKIQAAVAVTGLIVAVAALWRAGS